MKSKLKSVLTVDNLTKVDSSLYGQRSGVFTRRDVAAARAFGSLFYLMYFATDLLAGLTGILALAIMTIIAYGHTVLSRVLKTPFIANKWFVCVSLILQAIIITLISNAMILTMDTPMDPLPYPAFYAIYTFTLVDGAALILIASLMMHQTSRSTLIKVLITLALTSLTTSWGIATGYVPSTQLGMVALGGIQQLSFALAILAVVPVVLRFVVKDVLRRLHSPTAKQVA